MPVFLHFIFLLVSIQLLISCTPTKHTKTQYDQPATVQQRIVSANSEAGKFYLNHVEPILETRCSVCHGCYDAPCQLKLTSPMGIDRGANSQLIYHAARLKEDPLTRLGIDAQSTEQWREKSFYPVLNEYTQNRSANLQASLIYRLLSQKQQHPLSDDTLLDNSFDLSLNRTQSCPKIENYDKFAKKKPLWGMPYALPSLTLQEMEVLTQWLGNGAKMALPNQPVVGLQSQIQQWEAFLNQDSLKAQLVARYVYEHWFLGALYFDDVSNDAFFHLVRSSTPPGEPVTVIATRRPFDDPGVSRVYYRFLPVYETRLYKTHMPYALNNKRITRLTQLFFDTDYEVEQLPSYQASTAANPFSTFAAIPSRSRYKFMLDEAQFTIMGFIKGPVCRGNVALNVINDHFWVFFVDPDSPLSENDAFIASQVDNIAFPAEKQGVFENIRFWTQYSTLETQYLLAKSKALDKRFDDSSLRLDENLIWNGDGNNDNAALTVFRHFDSAAVLKGLLGKTPQTAWVIDYTLLERIHYLLVAGFDVYGNLSHQLLTRLHMDFLRLEGEFNFLALLPESERIKLRDYWYRNASKNVKSFIYGSRAYLNHEPAIAYQSDNPAAELITLLKQRLAPVINTEFSLQNHAVPETQRAALSVLMDLQGGAASILPETSVVLVHSDTQSWLYTITADHAYSNLTSLFASQKNRLTDEDRITVLYGVGTAYPSVFLSVAENDLDTFVHKITALQNEADYFQFLNQYGIRRTDKRFWPFSDKVHQLFAQQMPVRFGLLDFNRLENR